MNIRNRIVGHATVRAGDLVPHPMNYRRHPARQRTALKDSLQELGDIRSLLGYRLPDGRIQLIDGHLRRDLDSERMLTVELVDLTPEEAVKALLTLDPLVALAETDAQVAAELSRSVTSASEAINSLWTSLAEQDEETPVPPAEEPAEPAVPEKFLLLVECADEDQQKALLERFHAEGLRCKCLFT